MKHCDNPEKLFGNKEKQMSLLTLLPIHTRHLCMRFRIDGIKAMSCGISGSKQVLKFASISNRGKVCFFDQNETMI